MLLSGILQSIQQFQIQNKATYQSFDVGSMKIVPDFKDYFVSSFMQRNISKI